MLLKNLISIKIRVLGSQERRKLISIAFTNFFFPTLIEAVFILFFVILFN